MNNKHIIKLIALSILSAGIFVSCEKDYQLYEGNQYIQFGPSYDYVYNESSVYEDSLVEFTFAYSDMDVVQDTVYCNIYAVGGAADIDRPISIHQVEVPGILNCEPGVHYVDFNDESVKSNYILEAGEVYKEIPIIVLRDTSLLTNAYMLKIELETNDYFELGDSTLTWRKISVSDVLVKPSSWNYTEYYFGEYSQVKHRFLIETTGEKWDDAFLEYIRSDFGMITYYSSKAKADLAAYNAEHPDDPLRDENGKLVSFGKS
ncbi:MAG: DUF4843 domain-containing protein [Mangrovibacterium sp.]